MNRPDLTGLGTPEETWARSRHLGELLPLRLDRPERVVVVSPHPDDDVLGVGGFLAQLAGAGVAIRTIGVTDGEASHPEATSVSPPELAARRRREAAEAHRDLGLGGAVEWLGHPDSAVADDLVADDLVEILRPGDWCLAPFRRDGHPDHDASGRAAASAAAARGARLIEYLVWAWHWAAPGTWEIPWVRARRLDLALPERARKRRAIGAFSSQIAPLGDGPGDAAILSAEELAHHERDFEVVLV